LYLAHWRMPLDKKKYVFRNAREKLGINFLRCDLPL
jgi:hypothetical protein